MTLHPIPSRQTTPASHSRARTVCGTWLAAALALAMPGSAANAQPPIPPLNVPATHKACVDPRGAEWLRTTLVEHLVGDDSASVANRRAFALPRVLPSDVHVVTDETLCARALRAHYRYVLGPTPATTATVVRVADVYVVWRGLRAGEWTLVTVHNIAWEILAAVVM